MTSKRSGNVDLSGISRRDAGTGVHYGGTSPLTFERRGNEGTGDLTHQYHQ